MSALPGKPSSFINLIAKSSTTGSVNVLPVDLLSTDLRKKNEPIVEAVAFQGVGVFETLKEDLPKQVLTELKAGR